MMNMVCPLPLVVESGAVNNVNHQHFKKIEGAHFIGGTIKSRTDHFYTKTKIFKIACLNVSSLICIWSQFEKN